MSGQDKTLGVVVTIEATTDLEPNYHVENDFDNDQDPTFKPKTLTIVTRGYMEVVTGREHVALDALLDALQHADFEESVRDAAYVVTREAAS
jgi:hypothetical protein